MPGYRHVGGGWYELDDGQRVQGKAAAEAAATDGQLTGDEGDVSHEHRYGRGHNEEGKAVLVCYDSPHTGFEGCGHTIPR